MILQAQDTPSDPDGQGAGNRPLWSAPGAEEREGTTMMKNRTYRNFLIIFNRIKKKGWNQEEAAEITRNIFDQFEAHPNGLSIEAMAKMQCTKAEFEADLLLYGWH
jgi:hypothetical protein